MKLTYDDKVKIYQLRQSGWSWTSLSQHAISGLKYLVRLIDKYGLEHVRKGKNQIYCPELKQEIINEVLLKGRSQIEVSLDYASLVHLYCQIG